MSFSHQVQPQHQETEAEYRRNCRQFYRQSTSFLSDSDASSSDADEEDGHATRHTSSRNSALVVEAVDRLTESSTSFETLLAALPAEQRTLLQRCGLPTDSAAIAQTLSDPAALERLIAIRTEERKVAHERNIQQRLERVQTLFQKAADCQKKYAPTDTPQFVTTQHDLKQMQQTLKTFVKKYASSCVASHPLMAGLRCLIENQLEEPQCSIAWTFDAAVISEAVVAEHKGASDEYIQQAVTALTSCLVWIPNEENSKEDNDNNNSTSSNILLAVDPSLSNRTLQQLLSVLPSFQALDARPTGRVRPLAARDRTNADGEYDETAEDLCSKLTQVALSWRRW
jgi:hypothetical protein